MLNSQKVTDVAIPNITIPGLGLSRRNGITSEANETCAMSEEMFESLLSLA